MKAALTIWDGRISPVFDVCREVIVLEIEGGKVVSTSRETFDRMAPFQKVKRLAIIGIKTLVCGAITKLLSRELASRGIKVFGFVAGEIDEVVRAVVSDTLPDPLLSMPGCCGSQSRFRGGRDQGRGRGRVRGRRDR